MKALAATGPAVPVVLAALLGVAAGLGALLGAAKITGRPLLFLLAGLLAFCAAYLLALLLATRGVSSPRKRRVRTVLFCAGTALIAGRNSVDLWYFTDMGNGSPNFVFMRLRGY